MKINSQNIQRLVMASALASGLFSSGVAASAQTTAAPAATTAATTTITTTSNATNVSMSSVDVKAKRQAELEQANADARRMLFRNQLTSL